LFNVGAFTAFSATEPAVESLIRSAGTISKLEACSRLNAANGITTFRTRKNTANGNQVISIGAATTGRFQDTTNSDTVAAGDKVALQVVNAGATGNCTIHNYSSVSDATTNTVSRVGVGGSVSYSTANTSWYFPIVGNVGTTQQTVEAPRKVRIRKAGTFKHLHVYAPSNARTTTTTIRTRKNGANGAISVSISSGQTGTFENTANTETVVAGDDYNLQLSTLTGTQSFGLNTIAISFETTTNISLHGCSLVSGRTHSSGALEYDTISGYEIGRGTENQTQGRIEFPQTFSELGVHVSQNSATGSSTVNLRKNGAASSLTISFIAGATGQFNDSVNTVSVVAGDFVNYSYIAGTSSFFTTAHTSVYSETIVTTPVFTTKTLNYDIIKEVTDTITLKHNILQEVVDTNTLKFNVLNEVPPKTLTTLYNIYKEVPKSITTRYDVIAQVTDTTSLKFNVYNEITDTNTIRWNLDQAVTKTRTLLFNIFKEITDINTIRFNVDVPVLDTSTIKYNVTVPVTDSTSLLYNIYKEITDITTLIHNIDVSVTDSTTLRFNIYKEITKSVSLLYDIITSVSVEKAATIIFHVSQQVTDSTTLLHNILQEVTKSNTIPYNINVELTKANSLLFNVLQSLTKTSTTRFDIYMQIAAAKQVTLLYNIISETVKSTTLKYNVYQELVKATTLLFDIYEGLQVIKGVNIVFNVLKDTRKTTTLKHNIDVSISKSYSLIYSMLAEMTKTNTLPFNIFQPVTKTGTTRYSILQELTRIRTLLYSINQTVTKTNTIQYNIDTVVAITKSFTIRHNIIEEVTKTNTLIYDVFNALMSATKSVTLIHNINVPVMQTSTVRWDLYRQITKLIRLQHSIDQSIEKAYSLVYSILPTTQLRPKLALHERLLDYIYTQYNITDPPSSEILWHEWYNGQADITIDSIMITNNTLPQISNLIFKERVYRCAIHLFYRVGGGSSDQSNTNNPDEYVKVINHIANILSRARYNLYYDLGYRVHECRVIDHKEIPDQYDSKSGLSPSGQIRHYRFMIDLHYHRLVS